MNQNIIFLTFGAKHAQPLKGGHLPKADTFRGPNGVHFGEVSLYSQAKIVCENERRLKSCEIDKNSGKHFRQNL